jgi:3-oxoacyl-[acyl-carrier-protein] synthase II
MNVDPNIPKDTQLVLGKSLATTVSYALSNSFGFGGHNSSVILKKYSIKGIKIYLII